MGQNQTDASKSRVVTRQDASFELLRRKRMRESMVGYAQCIEIPQVPAEGDVDDLLLQPIGKGLADHHLLMLSRLQTTMTTPYGRLMMFMPPGSAKSTYGTVVAPSWYLGNFPGSPIILASHNINLAKRHGSRARNIVQQDVYKAAFGTTVKTDTKAKEHWSMTNESEYISCGIQSGITGFRASGILIDDPVRGRKDADSPVVRKTVREEYEDAVETRLIPGAWVIIIQTRWHLEDLAGGILPEDYDGRSGPVRCRDGFDWWIINLPAKIEPGFPEDPLGRKVGDYLWPEWFDKKHWSIFEPRKDDPHSPSQRRWSALYQQRPRPESGNEWERKWAKRYPLGQHPKHLMMFSSSDYAVTPPEDDRHDPDWSEHGIAGLDENGDLWVVDWWYGRGTPDLAIMAWINLCKKWGVRNGFDESGIIRRALEPQKNFMMRKAEYYVTVEYLPHIGDKVAKFQAIRSMGSGGRVYIPDCPWGDRLVDQLCSYNQRGHDDAGDVMSLFGRGLDGMPWSTAYVPKEEKKGVKFGSWEWLTMDSDNDPEIGLDAFR